MANIRIWVAGTPVPQGSKICVNGRPIEANKNLKAWRKAVTIAAHDARQLQEQTMFDCPVEVELSFRLTPPQKPRWFAPAVKPDVDKLIRAVFDGLTDAKVWADDSRVVSVTASKVYAAEPGVLVEITKL